VDPQQRPGHDKDVERRIFCKNYSECLQFVAELQWENFTCEGCKSYNPEHHGGAYWMEDAENCLNLIRSAGVRPGERE